VPLPEGDRPKRPEPSAASEQAKVYRELLSGSDRLRKPSWLRSGLLGLTAIGLAGWAWRSSQGSGSKPEAPGSGPQDASTYEPAED
jgi:hypothetical protein